MQEKFAPYMLSFAAPLGGCAWHSAANFFSLCSASVSPPTREPLAVDIPFYMTRDEHIVNQSINKQCSRGLTFQIKKQRNIDETRCSFDTKRCTTIYRQMRMAGKTGQLEMRNKGDTKLKCAYLQIVLPIFIGTYA